MKNLITVLMELRAQHGQNKVELSKSSGCGERLCAFAHNLRSPQDTQIRAPVKSLVLQYTSLCFFICVIYDSTVNTAIMAEGNTYF